MLKKIFNKRCNSINCGWIIGVYHKRKYEFIFPDKPTSTCAARLAFFGRVDNTLYTYGNISISCLEQ